MMKMRTLYKIDSVGKLREWTMVVENNSYHAVKGLVDGKKTTDKPRVTFGKNIGRANATTDEEQAELEAKARWDKKLKEFVVQKEFVIFCPWGGAPCSSTLVETSLRCRFSGPKRWR